MFDKVVARLDTRVQESIQAQAHAARRGRNRSLGIASGLLALIGVVGLFDGSKHRFGRLSRLKAVSDRLAAADISGLTIDVEGRDEIAVFGSSLKGVHAAIEELLQMAAAETAAKI